MTPGLQDSDYCCIARVPILLFIYILKRFKELQEDFGKSVFIMPV